MASCRPIDVVGALRSVRRLIHLSNRRGGAPARRAVRSDDHSLYDEREQQVLMHCWCWSFGGKPFAERCKRARACFTDTNDVAPCCPPLGLTQGCHEASHLRRLSGRETCATRNPHARGDGGVQPATSKSARATTTSDANSSARRSGRAWRAATNLRNSTVYDGTGGRRQRRRHSNSSRSRWHPARKWATSLSGASHGALGDDRREQF